MGPSIWQLLIVLAIVLLLFGAKRLRNLGGDLGSAIKGFRSAMKEGEEKKNGDAGRIADKQSADSHEEKIIEGEVTRKDNEKV